MNVSFMTEKHCIVNAKRGSQIFDFTRFFMFGGYLEHYCEKSRAKSDTGSR